MAGFTGGERSGELIQFLANVLEKLTGKFQSHPGRVVNIFMGKGE